MYKDPNAWRFGLAGLLFVAVFFNGANWRNEIFKISQNGEPVLATPITLDAWISPPTFTKKAPVLLTGKVDQTNALAPREIIVPEGSRLVVRINGAQAGQIVLSALKDDGKGIGQAGKVLETIELNANAANTNAPNTNLADKKDGNKTMGASTLKKLLC